ncbi:hypothetical protein RVY14_000695 [Enterobacter cloacae]|nr:hypothetical protein [Enterobacter cloacae]
MTTQPTNLPVPSESPRDLKFNAGKIDEFVSSFSHTYTDRFGSGHYTIEGIRWLAQQAIAAFGYITIDSFQEGATLTLPNQVLRWKLPDGDGDYYRWDGSFGSAGKVVPAGSTPATTGGVGKGAWVSVGYAAALNNLLSAQPGASNILGLMLKFTPVAYGALANATDDTAAFTACMAAMPSGATMDLQGLTYSVTDIEVTKPMRIINGTINVLYGSLKGGIYVHDTHDVRIDNVNVNVDYLNKGSYTADNVSGIIFENCSNVTVTNINAVGSKCNTYLATGSWGCPIHAYQCDGVTLHNCKASHSDKEGIMTRFCDNVKYGLLTATDCGYSGVGTSGGNGLIACNIWSYRSGLTNVSFNSTNFTVAGIYSEGNLDEGGICLGHTHEIPQYAGSGTASGLTIINSAKSGLVIGKHKNITVSGITIDTVGTITPGAGIVINDAMQNNCNVLISDFNLKNITGTGINYLYNGASNLIIDGGIIQGCTLNAVQAQHNGYTNIKNVTFRGNAYDIAVFPYASDGTQKMTALNVQNCDMEFTTNWNVVFRGVQHVKFDGLTVLGFNSGNTSTMASIRCDTIVGSTFELPDSIEFNNSRFNGTVGSGVAATIVIGDDGLATTGKRLKVNGCHFGDVTKKPIQYAAARMAIQWGRNTRGTDVGLQTVSIPSSGSVVINNSNITTEGMPVMVARGNSGFYVSSWALGTMTINNTGATSINLTIQH